MTGLVQRVERGADRDRLGEGCMWSARDHAVYWVDILGRKVNQLYLGSRVIVSWAMPDYIGWLIERKRGGFVAGVGRSFVSLELEPLSIEVLAAPEPDRHGNRCNDAKADAAGRIWAGTMPVSCDRPSGALYRIDPDGTASVVDGPYTIPNGPAITPDGRTLFHADSALRTVFKYEIRDDGTIEPRIPHIVFDGLLGQPDGMTLDADGFLWVACWGGACVARFDVDGQLERTISLPASQITSCTFAGDRLDRMFVTSAADGIDEEAGGCLFEVDPGCRGLPTLMYAG